MSLSGLYKQHSIKEGQEKPGQEKHTKIWKLIWSPAIGLKKECKTTF
jgi:hypothetical protein